MIPQLEKHTYEEFLDITKEVERVEYIDGYIIYMNSPTREHQKILNNTNVIMSNFFKGKECNVYIAPLDVKLKTEKIKHVRNVQPDIFVSCDESKFNNEGKYEGVPSLIVEVLSPSNASHDEVIKLNLYMKFGVSEYWIVYPSKEKIAAYVYDDNIKAYRESKDYYINDTIESEVFKGLTINLKDIFQ